MTVILWDGTDKENRKMLGRFDTEAQAEEFIKKRKEQPTPHHNREDKRNAKPSYPTRYR